MPEPSSLDLLVVLTRLEVKVDNALWMVQDHETRIRGLENNGYVSGKQLWAGLTGVALLVSALMTIVMGFTG